VTGVGIDVGGTKCLGVRLGDDGEVVAESRLPTPSGAGAILDTVAELVGELGPTGAVGVGLPGMVDRAGVLRGAPNLVTGRDGLDVRGGLAARLPGVSVVLNNDATCAAWAEHRAGAARGVDDMVLVTVGTGLGGGVVSDGRLLRGGHGLAGEVGNMVVDPYGPPCSCGGRGCWEALAAGPALGRMGRESAAPAIVALAGGDPAAVRGEHVVRACREGDEGAAAMVAVWASWLALGIANLVELFDPAMVVVGGGISAAADVVLPPVVAAFDATVARARHPSLRIVPAAIGPRAGAVGAALLAAGIQAQPPHA
jgi:glucokinase